VTNMMLFDTIWPLFQLHLY